MTDDNWNASIKTVESEEEQRSELDYQLKIADLESSSSILESEIASLKEQLASVRNENTKLKSSNKRISFQLKGRSSTISSNVSPTLQIAELIQEKNDLEEIAEKMLNMLTEKEIENNQLREANDSITADHSRQITDLTNQIEDLQEELEITKKSNYNEIDYEALLLEYNEHKERTFEQLRESELKEEQRRNEVDRLTNQIHQLNSDIQALEMENLQWINASKRNEEMTLAEYNNNQSIISVVDKLREELSASQKIADGIEKKYAAWIEQKEIELREAKEEKSALSKRIAELSIDYKDKIDKATFNLKGLIKEVGELNEKLQTSTNHNKDLEKRNAEYKLMLDKKLKELKEINETAMIIKQNKEKTIAQQEKTIASINESNTSLLEQNKELLNQLKLSHTETKEDSSLSHMIQSQAQSNEASLMEKENNHLKQLLSQQAKEIVSMNSLRDELATLKAENEQLKEEKDTVTKPIEPQLMYSKQNSNKFNMDLSFRKNKLMGFKRQCSSIAESLIDKKVAHLNDLREKAKAYFTEKIDKLNQELCEQKVKLASQEFEKDNIIAKYRNIIHSITAECKKKGITLTFKL